MVISKANLKLIYSQAISKSQKFSDDIVFTICGLESFKQALKVDMF